MPLSTPLSASFQPIGDLDALARRWQALEARSDASFFLRWTWIGSWLASYAVRPDLLPDLLVVTDDAQRDVALALFGHAMVPRLLGPVATLSLNQSGDSAADRPFIEYNGLLMERGREGEAVAAAIDALLARRDWRALRMSGMEPDATLLDIQARRKLRVDVSPVYQVDLAAVRAADGDYLSLLSANTRGQIRRAMQDHGSALPTPTVAGAGDIDPWLAEMAALNRGRHDDNSWDDPAFRRFVARLVAQGQESGAVELLRFTDAGGIVGLLLNFLHRGVAMNYQSAFAAPRAPKDKPGLLCHTAAVDHYAARNLRLYSLLAGKDRYKQSLSTCQEQLIWWSIERFTPRLEAEALLRRLLHRPACQ